MLRTPSKNRNEAFSDLLNDLRECDLENLKDIKDLINKNPYSQSSWSSILNQNLGTNLKDTMSQQNLHHTTQIAAVIAEKSLVHKHLMEHPGAKSYFKDQHPIVQSIVESYKLELYYIGKILESMKQHFGITMETTLVEHSNEHLKLEKFYGIDISTISKFQQFLNQLKRINSDELRDNIMQEYRGLRINPDTSISSTTLTEGATVLSTLCAKLYKTVSTDRILTPTEVAIIMRGMTSQLIKGDCSHDLYEFKTKLMKIDADDYNAILENNPNSSDTQFGMMSLIIGLLKKTAEDLQSQEDLCQHYNEGKDKSGTKTHISFFNNTHHPVVNKVSSEQGYCKWHLGHSKGYLSAPCKFKDTTCRHNHDLTVLEKASTPEKKKYICRDCGIFGCPRIMGKKFHCQKKNNHKKGQTSKGDGKETQGKKDDSNSKAKGKGSKKDTIAIKELRRQLNQARHEKNQAQDALHDAVYKSQRTIQLTSNQASDEESDETSASESDDDASKTSPAENIINIIKPEVMEAVKRRHLMKKRAKAQGKGNGKKRKGNGQENKNKKRRNAGNQ